MSNKIRGQARHGNAACNPSTLDTEAGGSPWLQGHPGLHSEFQDNLGYRLRPGSKNPKSKQNALIPRCTLPTFLLVYHNFPVFQRAYIFNCDDISLSILFSYCSLSCLLFNKYLTSIEAHTLSSASLSCTP